MSYTKGPWTVERSVNGELEPFETTTMNHLLHGDSEIPLEEREANARLIAAAPALVEALEIVAAGNTEYADLERIAKQALAQAKGQEVETP